MGEAYPPALTGRSPIGLFFSRNSHSFWETVPPIFDERSLLSKNSNFVIYIITRETHEADLAQGQQTKVQHGFAYSDGFGREIQKKIQAEPGPLVDGGPVQNPCWVGSGWTIFNNKDEH